MKYSCKCGQTFEIDESTVACDFCQGKISLENDLSGNYRRAKERCIEHSKEFKHIVESYEKSGSAKEIRITVSAFHDYRQIFGIGPYWRAFIINAADAAVSKRDYELQEVLKNHAKTYDANVENGNLYYNLLAAQPRIGDINDWEHMILDTHGDHEEFSKLCNSILRYIAKAKDKAFAIDIFRIIQAKSRMKVSDTESKTKRKELKMQRKKWIDIEEYYIRALLSNDDIADEVFTAKVFFKNRSARKFMTQIKTFCKQCLADKNSISIEATKVGSNYADACKKIKARATAITAAVLAVIAALLIAAFFYLSSPNKDTVRFTVDQIIELTYGEEVPLDGYYLTYRKNSGEEIKQDLTKKMLFGYDPEKIGEQQSAYFEFNGVQMPVTILVKGAQLGTPQLTQSGNYVTWEAIPHADSYALFINTSEVKTNETSELRYDLSKNAAFGELTVTVRAMSASGKYVSSEMSAPLTITKLEAPKDFEYNSGKLSWSAVSGAVGYELTVNGIPYVTTDPECTLSLNRGSNEITVIAKSSDKSVIQGVTEKYSLYYNRLDPITGMSYRDGSVYWEANADAKIFRVFVDGVQWKDFSRNNFSYQHDGFEQAFGSGAHKIEIVCMTSASGVENSDKVGYNVIFGNKVSMADGLIRWTNIGLGSTYFVYINDVLHTYSDSYFSASDCTWQNGNNKVEIIARLNGEEFICETFTVRKNLTPSISATNAGWVTDRSGFEMYCVNGGEWTDTLPDISSLVPGTHTVKVKRIVSAPDAFELESDIAQITIYKPKAPVIKLSNGVLDYSNFDSNTFELVLEYYDVDTDSWTDIASAEALVDEGNYRLRAFLRAKDGAVGYDCFLTSDAGAEITAYKPGAPDVIYNVSAGLITSSVAGAKFYYTDENGTEHEIVGGKVSNLPGGVFSVYARLNATQANMLHSENTPVSKRVSVFNLDIEFIVNAISGSNQCYFVFKGCGEIDSITYSYKIDYLNSANEVIGGIDKSTNFVTQNKASASADTISCLINYRSGGQFTGDHTQNDLSKIAVTVYINGGTETLPKSYTTSVK